MPITKLDLQTTDLTVENIAKIAKLFPGVTTEKEGSGGEVVRAIDFDLLKQELSHNLVDDDQERYRLDWPGKKASILKANTPISKTLRPVREDSVDFDSTKNVYIEGDNFEVLKILQESYLGKVKMIYIDPPYNTGKDFVYRDNRTVSKSDYDEQIGTEDEDGGKLFKNTDTNGRFHSDWLSMMYERLVIARDLLRDDGVIFMSIDDNEVHNLRKIADEIFGEENFVTEFIWEKKFSPQNDAKYFSLNHEQILVYGKNKEFFKRNLLPMTKSQISRYKNPDNDKRGPWQSDNLTVATYNKNYDFPLTKPNGEIVNPPHGRCWATSKENISKLLNDNRVWFGSNNNGVPRIKRFLSEVQQGKVPISIFSYTEVGHTQQASKELKKLFDNRKLFDYPKPVKLISRLVHIGTNKNDIIFDFFAGSGTTAHAVMDLNAEDGGNRKFVMVQLQEETDQKSEAYKAGYKTISDIGKERIRRAGKKIKEELADKNKQLKLDGKSVSADDLDIGFRVYRADSSSYKEVKQHPSDLKQSSLDNFISNIKQDRTPEDLLTQVILSLGLELSLPIEVKDIKGNKVFYVQNNALVACFDDNIDFSIIDEIASSEPFRVVFRDSSFRDDKDKINLDNRFKRLSPDTQVTVI